MTVVEPPERRPSRLAWPTRTEPTTTPAGTHDHKQSNGPLLIAFFCIVLLLLCNVGLVWFILARGAARDAAEQQMRQQIRDSWCQALDGFPAGNVFLDRLRDTYGCGPGLTPEEQQQLRGRSAPPSLAPPAAPAGPEPEMGDGASTNRPPRPTSPPPPPRPTMPPGWPDAPPEPPPAAPTTSPAPDPLVDLEPITEPLCRQRFGVCL